MRPRPNERWLREKRVRKGSVEPLLDRWRIRPREKLEPVEGVEAAGDGCGAAEGESNEAGESRFGDSTDGGDEIGDLATHVGVLFSEDKERSG